MAKDETWKDLLENFFLKKKPILIFFWEMIASEAASPPPMAASLGSCGSCSDKSGSSLPGSFEGEGQSLLTLLLIQFASRGRGYPRARQ